MVNNVEFLTLLFVKMPTTCGPTKPGIVAAPLVMPTRVPAMNIE